VGVDVPQSRFAVAIWRINAAVSVAIVGWTVLSRFQAQCRR
jgi:hypothetical protein